MFRERTSRIARPGRWAAVLTIASALAATSIAAATPVTDAFTYQGQLTQNGDPVTAPVNLSFRLHADEEDDDQVGPTLNAFGFDGFDDDGRFTIDLEFGNDVFDGTPLWLEIWVNGAPLSPRQPIMPAPYSVRALTVGAVGNDALAGSYTNQIDLTNPANQFSGSFSGSGTGLTGLNASSISMGTIGGSLLSGTYGNSVNFNNASNTFQGSFKGEYSGSGTDLTDLNAANVTLGNLEAARMPTGGSWNLSSNLNIGTGIITLDTTNSRVGIGTTTPSRQLSIVDSGVGFDRPASNQLAIYTSNVERVRVDAAGRVGIGVTAPTSPLHVEGTGTGILSVSSSWDGVQGRTSTDGAYGVWGRHLDGGRGVVGSSSGWAVYGFGDLGASGTKSFQIDHPHDPENKYLIHYAAEGPEPYNMYRGNVILDGMGQAWVDLPEYFEEINRDYHYQLTAVGAPGPNLHIAAEIINNTFLIAGGTPGSKVSWVVTAVRDDPYVRLNPRTDVKEKPAYLRGTYQHPELYDMPADRSEQLRRMDISTDADAIGDAS